jgi:Flp pilus assembly protein TadG
MILRLPMKLLRERRGASALIFALTLLPILATIALAIDGGTAISAKSRLDLAADAAALAGARTAANELGGNPTTYLTLGQQAGVKRFDAQAGQVGTVSTPVASVVLAPVPASGTVTSVSATATWTATYTTIFGALMGVPTWPLSGVAKATAPVAANYVNVELLLDVSASMAIGATNADMAVLEMYSPCDPSNAMYYSGKTWTAAALATSANWAAASLDDNSVYACSVAGGAGGGQYDGVPPCPVPATPGLTYTQFVPNGATTGQSCQGILPQSNNEYPRAGAPCALACHWDGTKAAGLGNDLWAMARKHGVTVRLDLLKNAANVVINQMKASNLSFNNLAVGIFTFAGCGTCTASQALTRIYPASGEAGSVWATALADVGAPPVLPNLTDTGIQPFVALRQNVMNDDTYFADAMDTLASELTAAGDGSSATTPKKVLFLVTDGFEDDGPRQAMQSSVCQQFKNKGYTIYVVYTPYYPLMHTAYLGSWIPIVEGNGPTSITQNLKACASAPADYISASDGPSLNAALLNFLQQALALPAHLTQ